MTRDTGLLAFILRWHDTLEIQDSRIIPELIQLHLAGSRKREVRLCLESWERQVEAENLANQ